jgi:hypothetical protein
MALLRANKEESLDQAIKQHLQDNRCEKCGLTHHQGGVLQRFVRFFFFSLVFGPQQMFVSGTVESICEIHSSSRVLKKADFH